MPSSLLLFAMSYDDGRRITKELRAMSFDDGAHVIWQRWSISWHAFICGSLTTADKVNGSFAVEWIVGMSQAINWNIWSNATKLSAIVCWMGAKKFSNRRAVFCINNSPRSRFFRNSFSFSCLHFQQKNFSYYFQCMEEKVFDWMCNIVQFNAT